MLHRHDAFERVSRAMRAPQVPAGSFEIAEMADLIGTLDRLIAARVSMPPCKDRVALS